MRISVRIKEVGGYDGPVVVEEGATIREALQTQGVSTEAKTIRLNNEDATLDTPLRDNDRIYVVPNVKGN